MNLYENGSSKDAMLAAMDGVFVTESGKDIFKEYDFLHDNEKI